MEDENLYHNDSIQFDREMDLNDENQELEVQIRTPEESPEPLPKVTSSIEKKSEEQAEEVKGDEMEVQPEEYR